MATNTRRKLASLGLTLFITILAVPSLAFSQATPSAPPAPANPTTSSSTPTTGTDTSKDGAVTVNDLMKQFDYKNANTAGTKIGAVNALPHSNWIVTLAGVVKMLLNISSGMALLALTVGGAMMVFSSGDGDMLKKGKSTTIAAFQGLAIIAVSYAIVIGVSQIQIFPAQTDSATPSSSTEPPATPAGGTSTNNPAPDKVPD